MDDPHLW
ncbi:hypothetical protein E2320_016545, partial [Naja naja]